MVVPNVYKFNIIIDDEDGAFDDNDDYGYNVPQVGSPTKALSCRWKMKNMWMKMIKMMERVSMVRPRRGSNATIFLQTPVSRLRYLSQLHKKCFKRDFLVNMNANFLTKKSGKIYWFSLKCVTAAECGTVLETSFEYNETTLKLSGNIHANISTIR